MQLFTNSVSQEEVAAMAYSIFHHSKLNANNQQTTSGNRPT